jgi:sulfite exporter TauE/SafE
LFFGLGTLPALVASSIGAGFLLPLLQNVITRRLVACMLFLFAMFLTFDLINGIT